MAVMAHITLVFVAGLITALATGLGAFPFFFVEEFSDRWNVGMWGVASGIMVAASLFGLLDEGLAYSSGEFPILMIGGLLAGVVLVEFSNKILDTIDVGSTDFEGFRSDRVDTDGSRPTHDPHALEVQAFAEGDLKKLLLILGILTIHSFPEGVAIGVSFAELGLEGELAFFGFAVPLLAVYMTIAISIHNIPEGTAISIPMRAMGVSNWRMVGAAVFSSLPQPIGAVIAFIFVRWAKSFLPFGYGFAAGAMLYLVVTEFIPEALESGTELPNRGLRELVVGFTVGVLAMVPLIYV